MKRIGKSSIVSSIWISEENDYNSLEKIFEYYWNYPYHVPP